MDLDDYCPVEALLLARQILHIGDLFIAFSFPHGLYVRHPLYPFHVWSWFSVDQPYPEHKTAAAIFFLTSCFASALSHFPSAPLTMKYDTLAPKFGPLFHCIVMIIDIVVAHRLKLEGDVKSVEVVDVYWL